MSGVSSFLEPNLKSVYDAPSQLDVENFNIVEFKPVSGSSFSANENVNVRINSQNRLIDWDRSYIKGTFTGSATGGSISKMGLGVCFKTITETVSGVQLPIYNDYNLVKAYENKLVTDERKSFIDVTESANMSTTIGTTATNFTLPYLGHLSTSDRYFPLCVCPGGIEWTAQLETNDQVFIAGSSPTYTITDFAIVLCLIEPSANYLAELSNGVSRGGQIKIPLELKKIVHSPAQALTNFTQKLQLGVLQSVNSITTIHRLVANMNTTSADAFDGASALLASGKELKYWSIQVNSQTYPQNRFINYYGKRPEHLIHLLSAFNVHYSAIKAVGSTNDFLHYSFKANESYGSGIGIWDGFLELNLNYVGAPSASDLQSFICTYDGILTIQSGVVQLIA